MAESNTSAEFTLHFEDQVSGPASTAAGQLMRLRDAMEKDTKAIEAMNKAMRRLKQGGQEGTPAFEALKKKIGEHKAKLAEAQQNYLGLGGGILGANKPARTFADTLSYWSSQLARMPGPLGGLASGLNTMSRMLGTSQLMLLGWGAAAVAVVAVWYKLTKAIAEATAELYKYGLAQAEARRNEGLRLEALTKMRTMQGMMFGLKPGNAKEMQASIDRVSSSVSVGRDEVEKYNEQLYRMGLRGKNLDAALEAVSIKASALGDGAAQSTMGWAAALAYSGGKVQKLTDDVKSRFGKVVAEKMLSSEVQAKKLAESYSMLFGGLDIRPLLAAKAEVTKLFSQATASGRALKAIVTDIVQPLIDAVKRAQPLIKRFFQGMILAALEVDIAFLKLRNTWRKVFGTSTTDDASKMQTALKLGKAAVYGLIGAFAVLTALALPVLLPLGLLILGLGKMFVDWGERIMGAFELVTKAWDFMYDNWGLGIQLIKESIGDWKDLGGKLIQGFIDGITGGFTKVIDAVTKLGAVSWKALKAALQIQSPSKVFAELGKAIPDGVEMGINANAPKVQAATEGLAQAPSPTPAQGGAVSGGGKSVTIDVGGITINADSEATAKSIATDIRHELEVVFEQLALQLGAAPT